MFFPGRRLPFWYTQNKFPSFSEKKKKQQQKNKKTKKKGPHLFYNFSHFCFQFSMFPFTIFFLFFSIFTPFPLPPFSRNVSKNFPVSGLWGALCPLPPPPPVTPLHLNGGHQPFSRSHHLMGTLVFVTRSSHYTPKTQNTGFCSHTSTYPTQCSRVFSGDWAVPPSGENFVNSPPPSNTCPCFWTKVCPPQPRFVPKNLKNSKYI